MKILFPIVTPTVYSLWNNKLKLQFVNYNKIIYTSTLLCTIICHNTKAIKPKYYQVDYTDKRYLKNIYVNW